MSVRHSVRLFVRDILPLVLCLSAGQTWGGDFIRVVQLDLARQMETVPFVKRYLSFAKDSGYTHVQLYLEGRIRTETFPYRPVAETYSEDQVREIVAEAERVGIDLAGFIARMKKEGYLPKENRTDPVKEIYESCTGELYLDAKRSLGAINTPRVQGVYALAGTTYDELPDFKVRKMTANGALNVVGADGRPISESKKLCVVYATNAMNSGMTFRDESCTTLLGEWGGDVLYECGAFDVVIRNENAAKLKAWAVDLTGARTEQLVTLHPDDETVVLKVDVAQLYGGPAVFFELGEE